MIVEVWDADSLVGRDTVPQDSEVGNSRSVFGVCCLGGAHLGRKPGI